MTIGTDGDLYSLLGVQSFASEIEVTNYSRFGVANRFGWLWSTVKEKQCFSDLLVFGLSDCNVGH